MPDLDYANSKWRGPMPIQSGTTTYSNHCSAPFSRDLVVDSCQVYSGAYLVEFEGQIRLPGRDSRKTLS